MVDREPPGGAGGRRLFQKASMHAGESPPPHALRSHRPARRERVPPSWLEFGGDRRQCTGGSYDHTSWRPQEGLALVFDSQSDSVTPANTAVDLTSSSSPRLPTPAISQFTPLAGLLQRLLVMACLI